MRPELKARCVSARLYIAGSSSAVPRPGRANSGYLLRSGGRAIAIDIGSGAFARMREVLEPSELDAIVISHMHADHFFDLIPLRYALRYEMPRETPLPVYLPPGGIRVVETVARPLKESGDFYDGVLDLREYDPRGALDAGACTLNFARTVHYIPAFAMRAEMDGAVLGFSADTAPCEAVADLVRDVDVFLCEAALGAAGTENGRRGHLNAEEAGRLASQANAAHLVLTHYGASANAVDLRDAAARAYTGPITVADDGLEIALGQVS